MREDLPELFDILSRLWQESAKQRDFKTVLELSLASRLLFRALPDAEGPEEASLLALHHAIEMVVFGGNSPQRKVDGDPSCSFCGRKPPEVKLAAGPNVFICDGCVSQFASGFDERKE